MVHPLDAAPEVLAFYRDFSRRGARRARHAGRLLPAPDGSGAKVCGIVAVPLRRGRRPGRSGRRRCASFGSPVADMIERIPIRQANTSVDGLFPRGLFGYWKSAFFSELSDAAIAVLVDAYERAPTDLCALVIEDSRARPTRVDPTATAYPHRQPGHNLLLISQWTDPADSDAGIAWARTTFEALTPHMADRAYTNYLPPTTTTASGRRTGSTTSGWSSSSAATTRTTCSTSTRTSTRPELAVLPKDAGTSGPPRKLRVPGRLSSPRRRSDEASRAGALGDRFEGLPDEVFEARRGRREPGGVELLGRQLRLERLERRAGREAVDWEGAARGRART